MNTEEFDKLTVHDDIEITGSADAMDKELKIIAFCIAVLFMLWWRML